MTEVSKNTVDNEKSENVDVWKTDENGTISVELTRIVNSGTKNEKGGILYNRQNIKVFNLPDLSGLLRRCFVSGLKVEVKNYYPLTSNWNEIALIDWDKESPIIEDKALEKGTGAKDYQDALKALIADFTEFCKTRATSLGKNITIYNKYIALLKQTGSIKSIRPKLLENLRKLWSSFTDFEGFDPEDKGNSHREKAVWKLQRVVYFDSYEDEIEEDEEV